MSVLVCVTGRNNDKLLAELSAQLPNVKIQEWPHCEKLAEIEFVLAWKAPETLWAQLPNLKVVQSLMVFMRYTTWVGEPLMCQ